MVLVLRKDEIADVIDTADIVTGVDEAFANQGSDAVLPERIQMEKEGPHGMVFVMPGFHAGGDQKLGLKVVTEFPDNENRSLPTTFGAIELYDPETGMLEALLDGTYITNQRTGAITAVAAQYLAAGDVRRVGVFGSGTQARNQVRVLADAFDIEEVRLYSPSDRRYEAVEALEGEVPTRVTAAESAAEVCDGADLVVTATTAGSPVFSGDLVEDGTLYVSIGSNSPDMQELPGEVMERAERVFVDDYDQCVTVGDIAVPMEAGRITESKVDYLASVVRGDAPGRTDPDQVFAVKSVGSVLLDLFVAQTAVEEAMAAGYGTELDIHSVEE